MIVHTTRRNEEDSSCAIVFFKPTVLLEVEVSLKERTTGVVFVYPRLVVG